MTWSVWQRACVRRGRVELHFFCINISTEREGDSLHAFCERGRGCVAIDTEIYLYGRRRTPERCPRICRTLEKHSAVLIVFIWGVTQQIAHRESLKIPSEMLENPAFNELGVKWGQQSEISMMNSHFLCYSLKVLLVRLWIIWQEKSYQAFLLIICSGIPKSPPCQSPQSVK